MIYIIFIYVAGGLWVYTDKSGTDEDGYPVHSSLYKNLVTNVPKQLMEYHDFPFPVTITEYFMHRQKVFLTCKTIDIRKYGFCIMWYDNS